jgi:hypothetical protein
MKEISKIEIVYRGPAHRRERDRTNRRDADGNYYLKHFD